MSIIWNKVNIIKGLIYVGASIVMYFTPDHVDHIIEGGLAALGVAQLFKNPVTTNV